MIEVRWGGNERRHIGRGGCEVVMLTDLIKATIVLYKSRLAHSLSMTSCKFRPLNGMISRCLYLAQSSKFVKNWLKTVSSWPFSNILWPSIGINRSGSRWTFNSSDVRLGHCHHEIRAVKKAKFVESLKTFGSWHKKPSGVSSAGAPHCRQKSVGSKTTWWLQHY